MYDNNVSAVCVQLFELHSQIIAIFSILFNILRAIIVFHLNWRKKNHYFAGTSTIRPTVIRTTITLNDANNWVYYQKLDKRFDNYFCYVNKDNAPYGIDPLKYIDQSNKGIATESVVGKEKSHTNFCAQKKMTLKEQHAFTNVWNQYYATIAGMYLLFIIKFYIKIYTNLIDFLFKQPIWCLWMLDSHLVNKNWIEYFLCIKIMYD